MTHRLKAHSRFYQAVIDGLKPFEVRRNDRDFQVGDILLLCEYEPELPEEDGYTGREQKVSVTFILKDSVFGIKPGYCVMGIRSA